MLTSRNLCFEHLTDLVGNNDFLLVHFNGAGSLSVFYFVCKGTNKIQELIKNVEKFLNLIKLFFFLCVKEAKINDKHEKISTLDNRMYGGCHSKCPAHGNR